MKKVKEKSKEKKTTRVKRKEKKSDEVLKRREEKKQGMTFEHNKILT